jgi:hypothetical protein
MNHWLSDDHGHIRHIVMKLSAAFFFCLLAVGGIFLAIIYGTYYFQDSFMYESDATLFGSGLGMLLLSAIALTFLFRPSNWVFHDYPLDETVRRLVFELMNEHGSKKEPSHIDRMLGQGLDQ